MTFEFCSLSSGSSGNCQYLGTDKIRLLIDAGFSGKRIEELLSSIDVCPKSLDGILVTHEHIDHIKGVGVLSRRYNIPIYANENTWGGMEDQIGKIGLENIKTFDTGSYLSMGDLDILPIRIFHDAIEPVGFIVRKGNKKISIITDTGWMNDEITGRIKDSDLYFIESNHDIQMLKSGSYPWPLKQRILSIRGHMSNEDTGRILSKVLKGKGERILLAHLSADNNIPDLALKTVGDILVNKGIDIGRDIKLGLSHRDKTTLVYNV